jgi:hypothetical protein
VRLTIRLLGTELLHVDFGLAAAPPAPDGPKLEASGGGQFEMGFQPGASWSPVERDGEGP